MVDFLELNASQERHLTETVQSIIDKESPAGDGVEFSDGAGVAAQTFSNTVQPTYSNPVQPIYQLPLYPVFNYEEIQHRHQSNAPVYYFNNSTVNFF